MTTKRIDGKTVELIEVHQIDFDFCGNTYGVLPCTATLGLIDADNKCFNTLPNCQDTPNFLQTTKTLTLSKPQSATLKERREIIGPYYAEFNGSTSDIRNVIYGANNHSQLDVIKFKFLYRKDGSGTVFNTKPVSQEGLTSLSSIICETVNSSAGAGWDIGEGKIIFGFSLDGLIKTTAGMFAFDTEYSIEIQGTKAGIGGGVQQNIKVFIDNVLIMDIDDTRNVDFPQFFAETHFGRRYTGAGSEFPGYVKDYSHVVDSVLLCDTPFNGSSTDLTGNSNPVDTDINYFSEPSTFVDSTVYTIPVLMDKGTSTSPTKINIGGRKNTAGPLGNFGTVSVNYQDIPHNDNVVDPYSLERSWNALERGTFWSKFLARNLYYNARAYRVYNGFTGQYLDELECKSYLQDKITNPDSKGNVSLSGVSPYRRFDDVKNIYPTTTTSKLFGDIDENLNVFKTIGKVNSAGDVASVYFSIGSEILKYQTETDNLDGTFTYSQCSREQFGSKRASHKSGDAVQHTVYFAKDNGTDIEWKLEDILIFLFTQAGFELSEIDLANWSDEIDIWLQTYHFIDRVIAKPTPIKQLVGELQQSCGFFSWFNETTQLVKIKAIRPEDEAVQTITEGTHLLAGQSSSRLVTNERISDAIVYYDLIDKAASTTSSGNYSKVSLRVSDGASPLKFGESVNFTIQAPWLISNSQVSQFTSRLLRRYEKNTRYFDFALDIKDDLQVGEVFKCAYSGFTDDTGLPLLIDWQVISRHRINDTIKIQAQEFYLIGNYFKFAPDGIPDYSSATDEQKARYGFYAPISDGTEYVYL